MILQDVPALRSINLYGADSLTLDNTGFQNLVFLQGVSLRQLTVRNNPDFTDATVLAVEELIVDSNPQLTTLSLPAQAQPLISLEVVGNPSLQSIDGGEDLTWLRALSVRDNPLLQTINLPWVQSLGTFQVIRNPSLSSIGLPLLTQQVDELTVVSNPSLSLPSIFSITGRARKYKLAGNQGDPLFLDPCPYARDNFCDEPPVDSICAPGTDRYDCEDRLP
ncbi:MAG TPA: hypothetical protein VFS67_15405 [Polyangiaceae bacterium]|nr:hypothetical protein [Polyangiaceae bacterium]